MSRRKSILSRFKACRNCKAIVSEEVEVCPVCGNNDFSHDWSGLIIIIDPEKSAIAKKLGIKKEGLYAIRVS